MIALDDIVKLTSEHVSAVMNKLNGSIPTFIFTSAYPSDTECQVVTPHQCNRPVVRCLFWQQTPPSTARYLCKNGQQSVIQLQRELYPTDIITRRLRSLSLAITTSSWASLCDICTTRRTICIISLPSSMRPMDICGDCIRCKIEIHQITTIAALSTQLDLPEIRKHIALLLGEIALSYSC